MLGGISKQIINFISWLFFIIFKKYILEYFSWNSQNIAHMTGLFISLKVAYNSNEKIDTLFYQIVFPMAHISMMKAMKTYIAKRLFSLDHPVLDVWMDINRQNTYRANACHSNNIGTFRNYGVKMTFWLLNSKMFHQNYYILS